MDPGGLRTLLAASCYSKRDKLQPERALGSYADLRITASVLFYTYTDLQ